LAFELRHGRRLVLRSPRRQEDCDTDRCEQRDSCSDEPTMCNPATKASFDAARICGAYCLAAGDSFATPTACPTLSPIWRSTSAGTTERRDVATPEVKCPAINDPKTATPIAPPI